MGFLLRPSALGPGASGLHQLGALRLCRCKGITLKLASLPYRLERDIVTWFYRLTFWHPSSAPFVSGDSFRALTQWRYGKPDSFTFPVKKVPENGLVFCNAWHLDRFLTEVAPRIEVPFRIVSHNGDPNLTDERMDLVPTHVVKLYSQNALSTDPRVVALPIGLEDARLHNNGICRDFAQLRRGLAPHRNRILFGFNVNTNPRARQPALTSLQRNALADPLDRIHSRSYRRLAAQYRFIASPPGNGEDCHRTWEAMYLGAVPIVVRSTMTERYQALGLPLWLVDSYDELMGLGEDDLADRYERFRPMFDHPALWMEYWAAQLAQDEVSI